MYGSFVLYAIFGLDPYLSILILIPIMGVLGLIVFRLLLQPMLQAYPVMVILLFLGVVFTIENALLMVFKARPRAVPSFLDMSNVVLGDIRIRSPQLVALIAALFILITLYWVLRNTQFGRLIRASAENPQAAALMGVNVGKVQYGVLAIAFGLLAVAGPLLIPVFSFNPYTGLEFTLFIIMIIVLGGLGNLLGSLVASFLIGISMAFSTLAWGTTMASAVPFAIFVLLLLFRPHGLFGSR
jgi:branched-chain amino acid transport system permease protein